MARRAIFFLGAINAERRKAKGQWKFSKNKKVLMQERVFETLGSKEIPSQMIVGRTFLKGNAERVERPDV